MVGIHIKAPKSRAFSRFGRPVSWGRPPPGWGATLRSVRRFRHAHESSRPLFQMPSFGCGYELVRPCVHEPFFGGSAVVVTEQVQKAMCDEMCDLRAQANPTVLCLPARGIERHDDVTKGLNRCGRSGRNRWHGKREDIGGLVLLAVARVEVSDRRVIAK